MPAAAAAEMTRRQPGAARGISAAIEESVSRFASAGSRVNAWRTGSSSSELDEKRSERSLIPRVEHRASIRRGEPEAAVQHVVHLGDDLHVAVLDAVVHHLDEMPGRIGTDMRDTWPGFGLCRNRLEDVFGAAPRLRGSAWHQRRT